jgi:hypothetical protein
MSESVLKMVALHSSKSLARSYIITQSHKPEDDSMNLRLQNIQYLRAKNKTKVRIKAVEYNFSWSVFYAMQSFLRTMAISEYRQVGLLDADMRQLN